MNGLLAMRLIVVMILGFSFHGAFGGCGAGFPNGNELVPGGVFVNRFAELNHVVNVPMEWRDIRASKTLFEPELSEIMVPLPVGNGGIDGQLSTLTPFVASTDKPLVNEQECSRNKRPDSCANNERIYFDAHVLGSLLIVIPLFGFAGYALSWLVLYGVPELYRMANAELTGAAQHGKEEEA